MKRLKKIFRFRKERSFITRHSFSIFIVLAIAIAGSLVSLSISLYNSSGAAQLDLSRPGYQGVRSQATSSESDVSTFSSDGDISKEIVEEFKKMFNEQAEKVKNSNAFSGDPLNPSDLGLEVDKTN